MQLNVVQVNSALFNHFPKTKRLVAEISDICVKKTGTWNPTYIKQFQHLYDDAADVGFALRNEKTGNVTRWALSEEVRDPVENELIAFKLIPTPESVRAQPVLQGYTMTLLND